MVERKDKKIAQTLIDTATGPSVTFFGEATGCKKVIDAEEGTMVRGEFFVNIAGLNQKSWLLSALLT